MFHLLALLLVTTVHAANYQQCTASSTCTIGEFLYNDNYTVLTGQSCILNAKYPDGTPFITSQTMTGRPDGWYSYNATIGTTEGLYAATICCTPASGTMCLDKSFEVKVAATNLTPADFWSYSSRTLTSYGSLVSDIWSYSGRSLTSFGSLVSDVWSYSNKTLTSFGALTASLTGLDTASPSTPPTLQSIVAEQQTQRQLLEKLVNAPIISLSLGDNTAVPDLQTKLDDSKKQASALYDTISTAKSRLMVLDSKWDRLTAEGAGGEIAAVSTLFQNSDSLSSLTLGWNTPTVSSLNQEAIALKETLASLLTATTVGKGKLAGPGLTDSLTHLSNMEEALGDTTNSSSDPTLFGYLASVEDRDGTLQAENQKLAILLENLDGQGINNSTRDINAIKSRLLALNQFPGGEGLAEPAKVSSDPKLNLKNILFSLQGLIGLNRQQLALNVNDPIRSLWLEEGSIIFRAVITNPSKIISQTVPLKFYLPRELKTEDIITLDPSLSTTYDAAQEALYASGTYELKPGETKLVYVETQDIWQLSDAEIQTLRTQAESLLKPLVKTAYFAQGTTLQSDIDVTLDKVVQSTGKAITPENRIRTYRQAQLELTKVTANMNRLQDLVAQASGTGSLFGFVGGVQTVAVWGIILVVVAGFAFLALYFKRLQPARPLDTPSVLEHSPLTHLTPLVIPSHRPSWFMPATIILVVVATAGTTIFLTQLAKPKTAPVINQLAPVPTPSVSPSPTATPTRNDILIKSPQQVLGEEASTFTLTVPEGSSVNIRNKPESGADIIMAVRTSQDIYVFQTQGDWDQIGFVPTDSTKGYWVAVKFVTAK